MSDYPEHDKLQNVADKSQAVGDFLEWLGTEKEIRLMALGKTGHYIPVYTSTEKLLSEFFEIDLVKLEAEKLTMIEVLRQSPGGG